MLTELKKKHYAMIRAKLWRTNNENQADQRHP